MENVKLSAMFKVLCKMLKNSFHSLNTYEIPSMYEMLGETQGYHGEQERVTVTQEIYVGVTKTWSTLSNP